MNLPIAELSDWLSPSGISTILSTLLAIGGVVVAILNMLGKKKWAQKAEEGMSLVRDKEKTILDLSQATEGIIRGVETFRNTSDEGASEKIKKDIQTVTEGLGVEYLVQPIVKAATGKKKPSVLADVLENLRKSDVKPTDS